MSENKKTSAKRLGVKTIIASEKSGFAIAAFSRGAYGEIVHRAGEATPRDLGLFSLKTTEPTVEVWRGAYEASLPNPVLELANEDRADFQQDYLLLKDAFEEEVFGRSFTHDNVRIQLAYNIFDMLKIFGVYVADAVYALDNLALLEDEKLATVELGTSLNEARADEFLKRLQPYFSFFGSAFKLPKSRKGVAPSPNSPENRHNKAVLRALGQTRQIAAHFKKSSLLFAGNQELADAYKYKNDDLWKTVAADYADRVKKIDDNFLKCSTTNLRILFDLFKANNDDRRRAIVQDYYDFAIVKSGKNLGVNMRKIREFALEAFYPTVKESRYDSYRSKIYALVDYTLYSWARSSLQMELAIPVLRAVFDEPDPDKRATLFQECREQFATSPHAQSVFDALVDAVSPEEREAIFARYARSFITEAVADLRNTADEEEKDALYQELAQEAWEANREILEPLFARFANSHPVFTTKSIDPRLFEKARQKTSGPVSEGGPASLVLLLSFLSNFWEGKEINEILTAFLHKLENIQAFIDLLTDLGDKPKFSPKYALFNELDGKMAGEIAKGIRFLTSVGKMKPDMSAAKFVLYKAAIQTLGVADDSEFITKEWLDQNVFLVGDERTQEEKKGTQPPKTFRNFIARNVIASRRFAYLVRYATPKITRATMNNEKIVRYTLSRLPESQIDRYYQSVDGAEPKASRSTKLDALTEKLVNFSFARVESAKEQIAEAAQKTKGLKDKSPRTRQEIARRRVAVERLKALTGLYLTVAYVALKNIVKANARYFIAYAIFERDLELLKRARGAEALQAFDITFQFVADNGAKRTVVNDLFAPLRWYLQREDDQDFKPSEEHVRDPELFRAACKAHLKTIRRRFTKKWREIFALNLSEALEASPSGYLATQARNVLKYWTRYVADFRSGPTGEAKSYFEIYHYIQQRLALDDPSLRLDRFRAPIMKSGVPSSDLIKLAYLPFGYCLPRYKNLTVDALFDKDGADGKARERRKAEAKAKKDERRKDGADGGRKAEAKAKKDERRPSKAGEPNADKRRD